VLGTGSQTISEGLFVGGDAVTAGDGTVTINDGSFLTVNTEPFANIARLAGSNGAITVTGTNGSPSTLRLEGVGTSGGGAVLNVGRGGTGPLEVNGGAKVEIDSLGAPLGSGIPGAGFPAGFQAGREAGSQGTVNLSGANTELSVTSDFAFARIGREGSGEMNITDNAALVFSGINSDFNVASDMFTPASGVRNGVLNVNTGGSVSGAVFMDVGGSVDGSGTVNLDGGSSSINLSGACTADCPPGYSFPNQGAFLTVGANAGAGEVNITNGAKFTIDSLGTSGAEDAGFSLGGNSILGGRGDGTLNVSGAGSELRVKGNKGFFTVGRLENGIGELNISKGGMVILDNNDGLARGFVGDRPSAEGTITVDGSASTLDAGRLLGVGVDSRDFSDAGKGTVKLVGGGTVLADFIRVGAGGKIVGTGTLASSTSGLQGRIDPHGKIAAGLSVGEILIDGDLILDGGTAFFEAISAVEFDKIIVTGDLLLKNGVIHILLGYTPDANDLDSLLEVGGTTTVGQGFDGINVFAAPGSDVPLGTEVTVNIGGIDFETTVTSVPVPATHRVDGPRPCWFGLSTTQAS
jgi:T5SS/PEP-CTERM-associated repeat protein